MESPKPKTTINDVPQFHPLFSYLFTGATYYYVDPLACITFTKTRNTDPVAKKLIEFYDNSSGSSALHLSAGFVLGTDTPCIFFLVGSLSTYVFTHFKIVQLSDREIEIRVKEREV